MGCAVPLSGDRRTMGAGYGGEIQVLPAVESREPGMDKAPDRKKEHTSTGLSAATMRALSAQMFAFYFRAPVRAFFRARVEYGELPSCVREPSTNVPNLKATWAMLELYTREYRLARVGRGDSLLRCF